MEKTKYKIGEFSIKPDIVDMWTGYRYYSPGQLQKLLFIIQLKDLGFTLSEIVDLYDEDSHFYFTDGNPSWFDRAETLLKRRVCKRNTLQTRCCQPPLKDIRF